MTCELPFLLSCCSIHPFCCVPEIAAGLEGIDEGREERELELRLLAAKRDLLLLSDKVIFSQPHPP
jgi:hypothetical protein